jgi:WD40 repeat protein
MMPIRLTRRNYSLIGAGVLVLLAAEQVTLRAAEPAQEQTLRTIAAEGHVEGIFCVAFSPDGKQLASGGDEGEVFVWDTATWRLVLHLQADATAGRAHSEDVWGVAFSPDGKQLATASHDETVRTWNAETGAPLALLKGHLFHVWDVDYSPDGQRLASAGGMSNPDGEFIAGEIRVWDLVQQRSVLTMTVPAARVYCVAFSPDGATLASGWEDHVIRIWDTTDGHEHYALRGHTGEVNMVAWKSGGPQLVSAGSDRTVRLWDATTRQEVRTFRGYHGAAFSADGERLATAGQAGAAVWATADGRELRRITGEFAFSKLALRADGKMVVWDSGGAALQVWSPAE